MNPRPPSQQGPSGPGNGMFRNSFVWLLILIAVAAIFLNAFPQSAANRGPQMQEVDMQTVANWIKAGQVRSISVAEAEITVERDTGAKVTARKDTQATLADVIGLLRNLGVTQEQMNKIATVETAKTTDWNNIITLVGSILPVIIIGVFLMFMLRQAQGANNQAISFGKSRAKMFAINKPTVTFADVAGVDEAKQELEEVVEFLKQPEKFLALGARIPRGVLLVGPPGVGKTLLARAVAGEAGVPFFSISGSEFVEMFVGVGASRVRDLFDQAKKNSPCIIFVDELDAVGRHRGAGLGGSHDEREQTLNQILVEMDGFDTHTNIIILAATNRPDILDPALLRPGRFDRQVVLDRPDVAGRKAILEVHLKGKTIAPEVTVDAVAKQTPGFSGADLANLLNEAALLAARRDKKAIDNSDLQEAVERVIAGPERKSRVISDREKEIIAYHESGHAVVMRYMPNSDPVHKVSIISRGMALGYTMPLPDEDRHLFSRSKFESDLAGLLGGRTAEELYVGDITTGAGNDLERATQLARKMVTEYGMSDKLGPLTFGHREELVFLGREISEQRNYSEQVAQAIDEEVRRLVETAHDTARRILTEHKDRLQAVAHRLIKEETLESAAFEAMFQDVPQPASELRPQPA